MFLAWYLQVDILTIKKHAKTINLNCAGYKVFVKYQAQGGIDPTPLRTPLICNMGMKGQTWNENI